MYFNNCNSSTFVNFHTSISKVIFLLMLFSCTIMAQDSLKVYKMFDDILVTANRVPTAFSHVARSVVVLDRQHISAIPASTIQDVLNFTAGVDVRQQGVTGIQADVSIRGTTFKQTLILLDGVKMTDPQTGHHNMNMPIALEDVERIEILKGQGARLFGPNAFGGVINIITKKVEKSRFSFTGMGDENGFYDFTLGASLSSGQVHQRVSIQQSASDGYRPNTDFKKRIASWEGRALLGASDIDATFGYAKREFGANGFYNTPAFQQWEETETLFGHLGFDYAGNRLHFSQKSYYRHNDDHYIWDRTNPDLYENFHETDVYGAEAQLTVNTNLGLTAFGAEAGRESIKSNRLGDHARYKSGIYFEHQATFAERLHTTAGFSAFNYSDWGWEAWPGFDLTWKISNKQKLYTSVGKAFRVPTYTELYYRSLTDVGNADLVAENAWSREIGYAVQTGNFSTNIAIFQRKSKNLIDWVWSNSDSLWHAMNITEITTTGFEMNAQIPMPLPFVRLVDFSYSYLNSTLEDANYSSKYVLDHLRHQFMFGTQFEVGRWRNTWHVKYADRLQFNDYIVVDTRFLFRAKRFDYFLDVNNVFDAFYREHSFIPQPGRWVKGGISFRIIR
ncbi:MAG: TonB-dependent receptor [Calditrichaeota bacterium]|nr:MAG: TonB-dependent receptor [Calditrichota bacterium]